jgi:hypothetical protein
MAMKPNPQKNIHDTGIFEEQAEYPQQRHHSEDKDARVFD